MRYLVPGSGAVSGGGLSRSLERAETVLLALPSVEGALARCEAGSRALEDRMLIRQRAGSIAAEQRADGSWHGSLRATALALLELRELAAVLAVGSEAPAGDLQSGPPILTGAGSADPMGAAADPSAAVRAPTVSTGLGWLRSLRGGPGRFGSGCTPEWHRAGLCEHTLHGFHAPTADEGSADPNVLVIDSARATEAALRWGERGAAVAHLDSLGRIVSHWAWPDGEPLVKAAAAVAALSALLQAPVSPANVRAVAEGIACLIRSQRADGTWHGVPLYDALELLLTGVWRGYHVPEVDAALARGAHLLVLTQKSDGTWGAKAGPRQPLTAWRVLRHAIGLTAGLEPAPA